MYTNWSKASSHSILHILVPLIWYNTYQVAVKALDLLIIVMFFFNFKISLGSDDNSGCVPLWCRLGPGTAGEEQSDPSEGCSRAEDQA